ncbi:MAG: hypothetical protein DHS20C15_06090 [Planctomycetota bacterium]|nr:MAG: hypothetical protein DHS20C15_06090 [Planctomycetota bacterium]
MAQATDLDRRWIFLAMGVLVVGLFASGVSSPMPVSRYVSDYYDTIEALPEGSVVMLSADFDPASAAELFPTYQATIHHLMRRGIRVVNVATWPAAPPYTRKAFDAIAPAYGREYGTDWVELGFKPGDDVAMAQIGQSIRTTYPRDDRDGTAIDQLPLMSEVGDSFEGIELLLTMSAGYPGILEWIAQAGGRYDMTMLAATTAVQTPDLFAYYPTQLAGFCGGATGATQYLQLVANSAGTATIMDQAPLDELLAVKEKNQKRMVIQMWGHLLIIALIVLGNVLYFRGRKAVA